MVQLRSNVNSSKYNLRKRKNNLTYSADERTNAVPALCTSSRLRNAISITRCTNTVFPDEKIKSCAAWNDLSDSTLNYSDVFVRLYFGNTASCIDGISVKDFADIYSNQFHSGDDVKWKGRQEYRRVRSNERDSIINESFSMIKTSQCLSFGVLQDVMASIDSNISCLSLMVKNSDNIFVVVTTCFFSIQTTNSGCSSYCNLKVLCTLPSYRRQGLGTVSVAILKEFTRSHPALIRNKVSDLSFIWCFCNAESLDFFFDEKIDFEEGWANLVRCVPNEYIPALIPNTIKIHCTISKHLSLGAYINNALSMDESPEYIEKPPCLSRRPSFAPFAAFEPGSSVNVRYPKVSSPSLYKAIVLDYNPKRGKPYLIQYMRGYMCENVVPQRIISTLSDGTIEDVSNHAKIEETNPQHAFSGSVPSHRLFAEHISPDTANTHDTVASSKSTITQSSLTVRYLTRSIKQKL